MSFDQRQRYGGKEVPVDELIGALASQYGLDDEQARELWGEALRAAADDAYGRSVSDWFGRLAGAESAPAATPGKRTAVDGARGPYRRGDRAVVPGRRTLTMREAQVLDARSRAQTAEAPRGQPRPLDAGVHARMSRAFGFDFRDVQVRPDSPEATGRTRAVVKDGEVHF